MHRTAGTLVRFVLLVALQVLEFHTRRSTRDRVAGSSLFSLLAYSLSLSLSPDLPFVLTSPSEEPPIVLYSETSFCFILPSSLLLSPSLALSLYGLLYALSERSVCARRLFARTRLRTRFAASVAEKETKRVEWIRSNGTIAEKKMRQ